MSQSPSPAAEPSVFAPLRRPRLRRMVAAQFVAETGDGISLVALPLYVWARTESEVWTSLTFAAELGFGVVLAVVGGMVSDAFDRRRVLLVSYLVRSALLFLAFAIDPLLLAVAFGITGRAMGMIDNPSFDALIPDQAEGDLQQVVAIRRLIQAVSITVGPGIGALAVTVIGPRPALALNAALFVVAFVILSTVRDLDISIEARRAARSKGQWSTTISELAAGMGVVIHTVGVRRLILHNTLVMGTVGLAMAAAVVFYERDLDAADAWYGLAIGAFGVGNAIGLGLAGGRTLSWPLPRIILAATPLYAVACAIGAAVEWPAVLAISWFLWGVLLGPEQVVSETFFVGRIDETQRGRAFAGLGVTNSLGMAAGSFLAAPLLAAFSARAVILGLGPAVLAVALLWIGPAREGAQWPDRAGAVP